jgi:amino acid transporter
MVAGGPYGLEDIIGKAGYIRALLMLGIIPFIWSLPTSLMVGELASAIPCDGGFYVWVRRAMGRFWGFQEAWLSLAASIFDMAIYPTIFVLYLGRLQPTWTAGYHGTLWALAVVLTALLWNLRGAKSVGLGSVGMFCVLLSPFIVLFVVALWKWHGHGVGTLAEPIAAPDIVTAISVCLWNYMGWDNASTIAQEVEDPQRNYPRAMVGASALVACTYMLPVIAVALAGLSASSFDSNANGGTGTWTDAGRYILGPSIILFIVLGGMISGAGMFNPLMMSYTRLPFAMAEDGLLPRVFTRRNRYNAPWASILLLAIIWSLPILLRFSFERLISIDLVLYGSSLILEFIALVILRYKEPNLPRPFRVPGGIAGAIGIGVLPTLLIAFALWAARDERVLGLPALLFATIVALSGVVVYFITELFRPKPIEPQAKADAPDPPPSWKPAQTQANEA